MKEHKIVIKPGGVVTAIYSDAFRLTMLGPERVERASNVEFHNDFGGWVITLAWGRVLCRTWNETIRDEARFVGPCCVFPTRDEALACEIAFINEHVL